MGRDKLLLRGLRLFGRHGVLRCERELGQQFVVDVEVETDVSIAGRTDDVKDTADYVQLFDIAKRIVQGRPKQLVECVATEIAHDILKDIDRVDAVLVRIVKPHVALPGQLSDIGVEICRRREDFQNLSSNK